MAFRYFFVQKSGFSGAWAATAFLVAAFLFGGGSRSDIVSLSLLRPAAVLFCLYGLSRLSRDDLKAYRWEFAIILAAMAWALIQLVPLPPGIWTALPGRDLLASIDGKAGYSDVWRPITLDPPATRNAFWSLWVPLAMLILVIPLANRQPRQLLSLLLAICALNATLCVLQLAGDSNGMFYFYRITNNGEAVGLFANRNHNAVFMATMIPMIAAWWSTRAKLAKPRRAVAHTLWQPALGGAAVLFLVLLIVLSGSRSGTVIAMLALAITPVMLMSNPGEDGSSPAARVPWKLAVALFAAVAGLIAFAVGQGKALAFERLFGQDPVSNARVDALPTVIDMLSHHWLFGVGLGSFDSAFRIYEPDSMLDPQYFNHVHNDWLEIPLTGGIPAVVLLAAALALLARSALCLFGKAKTGERVDKLTVSAFAAIAFLAMASVTDYPLRVPSLAAYLMLLVVWAMSCSRDHRVEQQSKR